MSKSSRSASRAAKASKSTNDNRASWIIGIVVVVVGVAAIVAIVANRGSSSSTSTGGGGQSSPAGGTVVQGGDLPFGTVNVTGTALPAYDASQNPDPAVGQAAPQVDGEDFVSQPVSITNDGKGKVVMLIAHWCPHCQKEVPLIQSWLDASGMPQNIELYSIATGTDATRDNYPPSQWLVGKGWSVPVIVDDKADTAAKAFGLTGYPTFVVIDTNGNVVQRTSGEITQDQWNALLKAADTGQAQALT